MALDVVQRAFEGAAEVRAFWQGEETREAGVGREIDDAARLEGVRGRRAEAAAGTRLQLLLGLREAPIGIAKK